MSFYSTCSCLKYQNDIFYADKIELYGNNAACMFIDGFTSQFDEFYFLIYGADRLDQINQLNHAQNLVVAEVEHDCIEKCPLYGIAPSDLIGPKVVYVKSFEPHSGKRDYLFSWYSKKPAVQVTGRLYNFDGQQWVKPQAIDLKWKGTPTPAVIAFENDLDPEDFEPHYTAIRSDFKAVFENEEPEINNAFMRAKLSAPKLQGKVTVHLMINTYGQVTAANIDSTELENPEFENNLIFIIKGLKFKSGEFALMEKITCSTLNKPM